MFGRNKLQRALLTVTSGRLATAQIASPSKKAVRVHTTSKPPWAGEFISLDIAQRTALLRNRHLPRDAQLCFWNAIFY